MSGAPIYGVEPAPFPRVVLLNYFRETLRLYEEKRIEPGADDLADPRLIEVNARHIANGVGRLFDDQLRFMAEHLIKNAADIGFAAGLGRPMPIIQVQRGRNLDV